MDGKMGWMGKRDVYGEEGGAELQFHNDNTSYIDTHEGH